MKKTAILFFALFSAAISLRAEQQATLTSPNGSIRFTLTVTPEKPVYEIRFRKESLVLPSELGITFDNGRFGANLKAGKTIRRTGDERYDLIVGKARHVHSRFREMIVPLEETQAPFRKINLVVRAFDDGVAFRYDIPEQKGWHSYTMLDENTRFNLAGDPKALALFLPSYTTSHEGPYTHVAYSDIEPGRLMDMPVLFEYPSGTCLAVTEAQLVDYAGMYLAKENGQLAGKLSPYPGKGGVKVMADLPHRSPWRAFLIGDRVGTLIESNLLTDLNDPCKIEDTSWIKPGKSTFPWWNGTVVPDTFFAPGNNFETNKYYIDFCARNGLEYHSVVEYGQREWYVNDGPNFMPGPGADPSRCISTVDMKAICDYAKSLNVDIRVWVHWEALYPVIDKAFAAYEKWGVSGMMVDFMDRDDQEMIRIQEEILQKAAQHKLHIQFHGSSKPSGLHRMYPNEFTREGTLNHEVYKWDTTGLMGADHDISMPFARMLAGPADYHLGGFRAVPKSEYRVRYRNPLVTSTRGHMLALYVVLESYLGLVCDHPQAYEGEPGFDFLQQVPTVWDEVRVPDARINEYITIARRNGNDWFVGALTDSRSRTQILELDFLEKDASYLATIYTDGDDTDTHPNHLKKEIRTVTARDTIELPLAAGGGAAVMLRKTAKR